MAATAEKLLVDDKLVAPTGCSQVVLPGEASRVEVSRLATVAEKDDEGSLETCAQRSGQKLPQWIKVDVKGSWWSHTGN